MKKNIILSFLLIVSFFQVFAQKAKTIELEVTGRPSWQQIIPLGKEGLVLFIKSDVTKALLSKYDTSLNLIWKSEIFLDAEKAPTAYTIDNEEITYLFSENQGMYYQLFSVNSRTGKVTTKGFELREFFQDQDYVFLKDRIMMAGVNEKGAAFYKYKFEEGFGEFIQADITGKAQVQFFNYKPEKNIIETLWAIREIGYTDEKKKKGEFTKDSYVVYAKFDTSGKTIIKQTIPSKGGNFPLTAKLTEVDDNFKIITGNYQSNTGSKGIYVTSIREGRPTEVHYIDYRKLLVGKTDLNEETIKKIYTEYTFLPTEPVFANGLISVGGTFFKPDYQTVTISNMGNNPYGMYDPYGRNSRYGYGYGNQPRSQSRQVFRGFHFLNGFVGSIDLDGNVVFQSRFDMNQLSPQINEGLAIAENKSVAYLSNGQVVVGGVSNLSSPRTYKLTEDVSDAKNKQYIAGYGGIKFWYGNYFIASGSRVKLEVIKDTETETADEKTTKKSKKKQQQSTPPTNIKKIIYLSKIEG